MVRGRDKRGRGSDPSDRPAGKHDDIYNRVAPRVGLLGCQRHQFVLPARSGRRAAHSSGRRSSPVEQQVERTLVDLGERGRFTTRGTSLSDDDGDREFGSRRPSRAQSRGLAPLSLVGRSFGYPHRCWRAIARRHRELSILHFDAHPDLYDEFEGNRYSHACPFARIMEEGLAQRLVQVGIRTLNGHQQEQARRFGVEIVTMDDFDPKLVPVPRGPIYVTIDLDGLDPAFAPGVAHPEAGGLSTRDVVRVLHRIDGPIVGADIVELLPSADQGGRTAAAAAKLAKELAALMIRPHR